MTAKEIKSEIRRLRRFKLKCRSGSPERLDLCHKIKELQEQLRDITVVDKDKQPLIDELNRLDPLFKRLEIDLNKFTVEQLKKHLKKLQKND